MMFVNEKKSERGLSMHSRLNTAQQEWVQDIWKKTVEKMSVQSERVGAICPFVSVDGKYSDKAQDDPYWWCNGFWPGILWIMHKGTGEKKYGDIALLIEERLDEALAGYEGLHHDIGFMWILSALQIIGRPETRNLASARFTQRTCWPEGTILEGILFAHGT